MTNIYEDDLISVGNNNFNLFQKVTDRHRDSKLEQQISELHLQKKSFEEYDIDYDSLVELNPNLPHDIFLEIINDDSLRSCKILGVIYREDTLYFLLYEDDIFSDTYTAVFANPDRIGFTHIGIDNDDDLRFPCMLTVGDICTLFETMRTDF